MIHIKNDTEIAKMRAGGKILGEVLTEVVYAVKPGMTELELDVLAEKLIIQKGGKPGFKKVEGYNHTICTATNDIVVHGIPKKRVLQEGDVIGIDCGVFYEGYHTDMAETILVSAKNKEIETFLETGKRALFEGIKQAVPGNYIGDISKTIQQIVEKDGGYSIVRSLIGHGVGKELHEEPEVPGYLTGKLEKTPKIIPGMTIAVEIIYNMGGKDVEYTGEDDWTIATSDSSLSGVFERTVAITQDGYEVLTKFGQESY